LRGLPSPSVLPASAPAAPGAGGALDPLRQAIVLHSHIVEMLSDPGGGSLPCQLANPRRVIAIISRRQGRCGGLLHWGLSLPCIILAAAIAGCFAQKAVAARPRAIVVEPESAACVMQNAIAHGPSHVDGDLATNMAMLSCGEASAPAWVILSHRADAFMTVSDDDADQAVAWLGDSSDVPGGIRTTPSGAAGLAGALAACGDPESAARLELAKDSRVLIFATESADRAAGTAG